MWWNFVGRSGEEIAEYAAALGRGRPVRRRPRLRRLPAARPRAAAAPPQAPRPRALSPAGFRPQSPGLGPNRHSAPRQALARGRSRRRGGGPARRGRARAARRAAAACTGAAARRAPRAPVPSSTSSPAVEHGDPVGEQVDDGEVVADEQRREPELALQLVEQLQHPRLHRDVERGGRLVGDQQLGVRAPARGPGWRAAAGRRRARAGTGRRTPSGSCTASSSSSTRGAGGRGRRRPACARPAARRRTSAMVSSGLKLDAGSWKTKPIRSRTGRNAALLDAVHLGAEHLQRAAGDLGQPGDGPADRRLAAAALADQAEHLARADREADAVDRDEVRAGRSRPG